jgi:hypothetical protein
MKFTPAIGKATAVKHESVIPVPGIPFLKLVIVKKVRPVLVDKRAECVAILFDKEGFPCYIYIATARAETAAIELDVLQQSDWALEPLAAQQHDIQHTCQLVWKFCTLQPA